MIHGVESRVLGRDSCRSDRFRKVSGGKKSGRYLFQSFAVPHCDSIFVGGFLHRTLFWRTPVSVAFGIVCGQPSASVGHLCNSSPPLFFFPGSSSLG